MNSSKIKLFLVYFFIATPVYALPIPAVTSAVFGIGEITFLLIAALSFYFPFMNKTKGNMYLYILLILSLLLNLYYFTSSSDPVKGAEIKEYRPGMIVTQEERNKDPHAIGEKEAYDILVKQQNDGTDHYFFIDARSRSETELGTAPGFNKISWPDLLEQYSDQMKGKAVIATCWTGMRGSEVCSKLREHGIDCRYLREGFKGWVAAHLPVILAKNIDISQFGTGEVFQNSDKLLTTREAVNAAMQGVSIIDIRSPKKFQEDPIINSINIPFGEISTNDMEYRVRIIPTEKVIIACYGSTSCIEAAGWGWEMNRLGHQYLGAYSGGTSAFNHVYFPKKDEGGFYIEFRQLGINIFEHLIQKMPRIFLISISTFILGLALFATKHLSLAYFTNFKERKTRKDLLKQEFINDEWAQQRQTQQHSKKDFINIVKSFMVLSITLISGFFADIICSSWGKHELFSIHHWQENIGISFYSILSAIIITFSLSSIIFKKIDKNSSILSIFIFYGLLMLLKEFSKIALLVLMMSCMFMYIFELARYIKKIIQKLILKNQFNRGYLSLQDAYHMIPNDTKAYRLSYLKNQGFDVPGGFIVKGNFKLGKNAQKTILSGLGNLFAVRSSALNEDMSNSSHAGLNLSIVPSSSNTWINDINKVYQSYKSKVKEIVLLQKYINPRFSGVAFSQHPGWGGVMAIEWGQGLSAKRMDGSENVNQIIIERAFGQVVYSTFDAPEMLKYAKEIYHLILRVEKLYGVPQDIEWAIDEKLWLVQARPQSALNHLSYSSIELDRQSVLNPNFKNLNACELSWSMHGCTPLSASLICSLWDISSSADRASRIALWKWNLYDQKAYIYKFGRIWNSDYCLFNKPNKISWIMSQKAFKDNLKEINNEALILIKNNSLDLAINWSALSKEQWLMLWNKGFNNWKNMQKFAFYFEFMADMAIDDCIKILPNAEQFLSNGKKSFYSTDISYRSNKDYEISEPRYIESKQGVNAANVLFGNSNDAKSIIHFSKKIQNKINLAKNLIYLREQYKHYCLNCFYLLRLGILDAQKRLQLTDVIFEMRHNEIENIFNFSFGEILNKRFCERKDNSYELPEKMDAKSVASIGRKEVSNNISNTEENLCGIFVSHPDKTDEFIGKLLNINENSSLEDTEKLLEFKGNQAIIYSKSISPHLVDLACKYKVTALCSLYGSMLSHPAILAREANLPFIVNVSLNWEDDMEIKISQHGEINQL